MVKQYGKSYLQRIEKRPFQHSAKDTRSCEVFVLKDALKYLDANFFNDSKVEEMAKGAEEFNIPMFESNRKMVASVDRGLYDPLVLVFNSSWDRHEAPDKRIKFNYPSFSEVQRPNREDDIVFMTVVNILSSKGVNVVPFKLNYTVDSVLAILNFTMDVDTLSHFDEWHRSGHDDEYEAQDQWPVELRRARLIPAVDYIQALALAMAYQSSTNHHRRRPPIDDLGPNDGSISGKK